MTVPELLQAWCSWHREAESHDVDAELEIAETLSAQAEPNLKQVRLALVTLSSIAITTTRRRSAKWDVLRELRVELINESLTVDVWSP